MNHPLGMSIDPCPDRREDRFKISAFLGNPVPHLAIGLAADDDALPLELGEASVEQPVGQAGDCGANLTEPKFVTTQRLQN